MKIKALITLTVGKQKDVPPGKIYDLGDSEAKRLIALGFAESVKKSQVQEPAKNNQSDEKGQEDGSSSGKSG